MNKMFAVMTALVLTQPFCAFAKTKMTSEIRDMFIENASNSIVAGLIVTKAKSCDDSQPQDLALVKSDVDTRIQYGLGQIYAFVGSMLPGPLSADDVREFNRLGLKKIHNQNLESYITQNVTSLPAAEIPKCLAKLQDLYAK